LCNIELSTIGSKLNFRKVEVCSEFHWNSTLSVGRWWRFEVCKIEVNLRKVHYKSTIWPTTLSFYRST